MVCGALAGMTATVILYPMDVIKTHHAVNQRKSQIHYEVAKVFRASGLTGMYKGLSLSLIGGMPFVAIRMSIFDYMNTLLKPFAKSKS